MPIFRLYYLHDGSHNCQPTIDLPACPEPGDVLYPEHGDYHLVVRIHKQKTGIRLDLSKGAESEQEAIELAASYEDWPIA